MSGGNWRECNCPAASMIVHVVGCPRRHDGAEDAEWIKTADMPPADQQEVLFYWQHEIYQGTFYVNPGRVDKPFFAADVDNVDPDATKVSHWMPLPAKPHERSDLDLRTFKASDDKKFKDRK